MNINDAREIALPSIEELARRNADTTGRNDWDNVSRDDYGLHYDYEILDHGSIVVLYPICRAAREWFYKHLPADCPRWGAEGFAVERNYVERIVNGLYRDGLISDQDKARDEENDRLQWEDR